MKKGDIVARRAYNCDIYFHIVDIKDDGTYMLNGMNYRLCVSAEEEDLVPIKVSNIHDFSNEFKQELNQTIDSILDKRKAKSAQMQTGINQLPGKVLHIDADRQYLNLCKYCYKKLEMRADCRIIPEYEQPQKIEELLKKHMPDILIITGHDSLADKNDKNNIEKYKSSKYFIEAVKKARLFQPSKDSLIIIAGACQSFFESLINNGANIASSPKRILIHALDPLLIAERIAYTPFDKVLSADEILENTITGNSGMGAYQTRGTLREGTDLQIEY